MTSSQRHHRILFVCGRYTLTVERHQLEEHFQQKVHDYVPRFNIAPSQILPIVKEIPGVLSFMKWGLIPSWTKDPKKAGFINARSESLAEKPSFRSSLKRRRCLVPASGFYEWTKVGTQKVPHYISLKDEPLFAFAGLFEHWTSPEGEVLETFTIITCEANEFMKEIHDRMPVILPPKAYSLWLDTTKDPQALLQPYPSQAMKEVEVSRKVNSPKNDSSDLIQPVKA